MCSSLFLCSLKNKDNLVAYPNTKVLIRIYGLSHEQNKELDSLITLLLAERKMGPKLLGVFPGGRIEEFIEVKV